MRIPCHLATQELESGLHPRGDAAIQVRDVLVGDVASKSSCCPNLRPKVELNCCDAPASALVMLTSTACWNWPLEPWLA